MQIYLLFIGKGSAMWGNSIRGEFAVQRTERGSVSRSKLERSIGAEITKRFVRASVLRASDDTNPRAITPTVRPLR